MKKFLLLICLVLSLSLLTACKFEFRLGDKTFTNEDNNLEDVQNDINDDINDDDERVIFKDNNEDEDVVNDSNENIENTDNTTNVKVNPNSFADGARFSTVDNPIKMGEAGIILESAYNDGEFKGEQIYLRVKEKLSNSKAAEIAEEYNKDAIIRYELSDGIEWNGVIVEIDLKDYPITSKYGTSATYLEPSLNIASKDDGSIKWNGAIYFMPGNIVKAVDRDQDLFQGDIFECYFVYGLPEGFDEEYLIKAFNYKSEDHTYTYFLMK